MPATGSADPTAPARPLRADARRNRLRVLDVAQEMFIAEGMAVTMDAIAEAANVGIGTVYRHFPTKEALFVAIITSRIQQVVDYITELADAPDPGAAFFELFARVVEDSEHSKGLHDALVEAGFTGDATLSELGNRMMAGMDVLLDKAKAAGAVRTDVSVTDVKAMMVGVSAMRKQGGDRARTLDVVLRGLLPTPR